MLTYLIVQSHPIQYNAPLFRSLSEDGVSLVVLYLSGNDYEELRTEFSKTTKWDIDLFNGYDYNFLNEIGLHAVEFLYFLGLKALWRVHSTPSTYLFIHGYNYLANIILMMYCVLNRRKFVYRSESTPDSLKVTPLKLFLKKLFIFPLIRRADKVFYIGRRNYSFYVSIGVKPERLRFCPYAVDNARFESARRGQMLRAPGDSIRFLWVGKFIERKRPLDAINAFYRAFSASDSNTSLLMVGDGPLFEEARDLIKRLGLESKVRLSGFTNQASMPSLYGESEYFLITSDYEPWGLVCNEAMAAGCVVISSDQVGSSDDLVQDGVSGFLYKSGDIEQLALTMSGALSYHREPIVRESIKIIKYYSYKTCVDVFRREAQCAQN